MNKKYILLYSFRASPPCLPMTDRILKPGNIFLKRFFDLSLTILSLPVALPLALILCALIRLDSPGNVIYCQERVGRQGKVFRIYKFRTMVMEADESLGGWLRDNPDLAREWRESQKLRKDPRLTRMGEFLRKTSLDELPQLYNILLGDMSLVGPRPIVRSEIAKYGRFFKDYCKISPGLTGLWQISGRNNTTYKRRVACDYHYIRHWSPGLDMLILAKTFPVAIGGYGAY